MSKEEEITEYRCPFCNKSFKTYKGLSFHVFKNSCSHKKITAEDLLILVKYNGKRPTCKCGCGGYTDINYEGGVHFSDYVLGHSSKIHNNWGHNQKAIDKSSNTRRKQYKNKERVQWNKGKTWKETYSEEKIHDLIECLNSEERRNKISKALKGVPKTEEHRNKMLEHLLEMNSSFPFKSKEEDLFVEEFIEPLNIKFYRQYWINDIRQLCDVYIPSINTVIEYNGDFFHCNPKKYPNGAKYQIQIDKLEKDKIKKEYLKENNINLLEIWEDDFLHNKEYVRNMINELFK